MRTYKLTRKANSDLREILLYTTDTWGDEQADRYLGLLLEGFDLIAQKPGLGRACDLLYPGLRRLERGKHVIFYRQDRNGVVISRILHQRRLPSQTFFMET